MKQIIINVYPFEELPEHIQEKVVDNQYDINVNYEWWQHIYMDAENVELKIEEFDIDRGSYVDAQFIISAKNTAKLILENHGEQCDTYKTAKTFLEEYDDAIKKYPDTEDESGLDDILLGIEQEFLNSLCEDYRIILQNSFEYLTSREAIIETINANEYTFTIEGKMMNA